MLKKSDIIAELLDSHLWVWHGNCPLFFFKPKSILIDKNLFQEVKAGFMWQSRFQWTKTIVVHQIWVYQTKTYRQVSNIRRTLAGN